MRRNNKTCFCEIDFLKEFFLSHPQEAMPDEGFISFSKNWFSLCYFLCKSDLVINVSISDFQKLVEENSWFKLLWKKSGNGDCKIEFVDNSLFPDIANLVIESNDVRKLNAVYLSSQPDQICIHHSKKYGIIVLNNSILKNCDHLFIDNGTSFPNERAKGWSFIQNLNRNYPQISVCNSLLIVDNYLFSDVFKDGNVERLDYNLQPILKFLLPDQLDSIDSFEIAVFTDSKNPSGLERPLNYLRSLLGKIRPKIKFKLSLYGDCHSFFMTEAF